MKNKNIFMWLVLVLMGALVFQSVRKYQAPVVREVPYGLFREHVRKGVVASVRIEGSQMKGQYKEQIDSEAFPAELLGQSFVTQWVGTGDELTRFLEENKVYNFQAQRSEKSNLLPQLFVSGLPILLMLLVLFFMFRQVQTGGGKAFSFGKSKTKSLSENQKRITFKDVAGIDEAKEELQEIIDFLKDPKKFTRLGGRIPKGVLLVGSPGTGKTLLAKAIAGEAGVPFLSISGSDFVEMFVGVGASRVRDLFEQAKKQAPCIVFIDEIDAVGRHRGAGLGGGHDEREQTLNQLLVEMDGFEFNEGVILIAATNRPDVLDPALLRPGRFDRHVMVPRPDLKGREGILKVHTKKVPLAEDVSVNEIARGTPGFTGADLENLVNESALLAARKNQNKVFRKDFDESKDKILMGKERKGMVMSEAEIKTTAYHEAGHALVAKKLPMADPVHKVTIIPRGMALGLTQQLPLEDKYSTNEVYSKERLAILMGGRVAEEIVFNQKSSGASNDIEVATDLARKMICQWGMSEKLGPLNFGSAQEEIFLARDFSHQRNYSDKIAEQIDQEIKALVVESYERAKTILTQNRNLLEKIAQALLEHETIDESELNDLIAGKSLIPKIKGAMDTKLPEPKAKETPLGVPTPVLGEG